MLKREESIRDEDKGGGMTEMERKIKKKRGEERYRRDDKR